MPFDFITNISNCASPTAITQFLGMSNLGVIYYTHIPTVLVALVIGTIVLVKDNRLLISRVLFLLSILFLIWTTSDLFTWISFNSQTIMSAWAITAIFQALIYVASFYFIYVFVNKKDLSFTEKIVIVILLLPILIFTPTTYNLSGFNYNDCTAIETSGWFNNYIYLLQLFFVIRIIFTAFIGLFKSKGIERTETFLASLGILLFLASFFVTGYLSIYLADKGILTGYAMESYGLFGMMIFMAFLAYLIVKFKAFNIKLIGAQALVLFLVLLIGSQFLYLGDMSMPVIVITAITLVIASGLGLALVRGVKREISLREKLEDANAGQKNLIHVMNHQIKGYLGTNKNIFAELMTDDYGHMPDATKPLLQRGLEESDLGVQYVTDILRGASAESGTLQYNMLNMDLKSLVSEVSAKQKEIADKKGLKFSLAISDGVYNILGDKEHMNEAIKNLINNSINYTPAGSVDVNLSVKGKMILLKVRDTGVGIKPEDRPKLFRAGGVGRDSLKVNVNSSGYGLVFTKGVIEAHKGKVWFESEGEGKGTTFFVELPVK